MAVKRKRRVTFTQFNNNKHERMSGWFHDWGLDVYDTGESFHTFTAAIIVDDNGHTHMIPPRDVTFV